MGRRRGEAKRITPGSKPTKVTLYTEDDPKEEALSIGDPGGLNANDGELPLFSSPKLVRSSQVDRGTREIDTRKRKSEKSKGGAGHGVKGDVSADVHLGGHVDSGWPLGNQEVATWSSSFRFELDSGRLQEMLPTANGSFRSTPGGSFRSIPGGSFRFRNGVEEISGMNLPHGSHLKPPRQMENPIHHGSNRFAEANASIAEVNSRSSESTKVQGGDIVAAPSSDSSVVPVGARKNVAVDVPDSPERSVILQRLRDLKTASPRFGLEDDVSYHKDLAKLTVGRDDGLNQWLKPSSPLWKCNSSTPTKTVFAQESTTDVETMPMVRKQSSHSSSPLRGSAAPQELASVTPPSSRFKNDRSSGSSLQKQILSISKQSRNGTSPSPDHAHFLPAAIPFQWEDQPGKPKSIRLSRKLSREAVEIVKYMESIPFAKAVEMTGTSADGGIRMGDGDGDGDQESHRFYGKAQHSREASLGQSSRSYSTNEKLLDLDASAAAKFLVEQYDTPLSTPGRQSSSPAFSVPFKWEDAPGKAKVGTPARKPNLLQLPPRLAVPSYRSVESFDRVSHPLAGFFAPCITASSPGSKHALASCKSLPPRVPSPPEQRRKRLGLVGRCSSLPQEGCQITVSRSAMSSPTLKQLFHSPSSPTSILTGPDGTSSQTSTSNFMFSSGDLDDFTQQTSKSSSYASIEEDFAEGPNSSSSSLPAFKPDPHRSRSSQLGASTPSSFRNGNPATPTLRGAPSPSASRNSDSATPTWLRTSTASRNDDPATSTLRGAPSPSASRNSDPATPTWLRTSKASRNGDPATSTLVGAPSASASRNGDPATSTSTLLGAPASRNGDPKIQPALLPVSSEAQASPKRPTRLPYTMPSVAEQMLASFGESARRQLIQDLSPRLLGQYSGRRLTRSSKTQAEQSTVIQPPAAAEGASSPSPAYAAALELLSPAVNLMAQRRKGRSSAKSPLTKPHRRRPRFMLSICRTLKRVILGKRRRHKPIEPKLMVYCDAPSTFQFSKSY